ncbi:MAG: cbb3-type cytochrome c oxidase subunit 3 [Gemmatimonadota bacterium]|nr:MAG: cbb3-type cytochrome c oxidase subunit 3 [Gemmatimonadota bacterium]
MNPLLREAAESISLGWLAGLVTVFFLAWFIGWTWWAFSPKNKQKFEEAARMPLSDGGDQ